MIIKAKDHKFIRPFFRKYTNWLIKRNFYKVIIHGSYEDKKLPLLILSNHMSWWDGFWLNYLNTKIFRKRFHFMMLEEQLRKYWYFQYTGAYSVKKGHRSVLETLSYTSELLSDKENLVLIFPQGDIASLYTRYFKFGKGIETILNAAAGKVQVLFIANLLDYFSNKKPSLFIYINEYLSESFTADGLQSAYNVFYENCLNENQKIKQV